MKKVSLTIDGVQIEADSGTTVLEAAEQHGIYIPTLCYHPLLTPFGGCRLCIVEVAGTPGFPAACTTPVANGLVVRTATEQVQELRREVLKLLLARHPYTCLVCERKEDCDAWQGTIRKVGVTTGCQYCPQNAQCELQKLVEYLGVAEIDYPITYRGLPVHTEDPFFDQDYNLCIVCGRCVRVCQEVRYNGTLAFTYRGDEALVGPAFNRPHLETNCEFCGSCVDVCPTGALADKRSKWEGVPTSAVATICPYCSVGCSLDLNLKNGRVISSTPHYESPVNHGQACVRGRYGVVEIVHSMDRLTVPLVRKNGRLVETSWDEAVEVVANGFARYRADQFALITSAGCTNEENYVLQKFARAVMGSNNIDFPSAFPFRVETKDLLRMLPAGNGLSIHEVGEAAGIMLIGTNTCQSHPVLGVEVRKAAHRGSKLITVDVRETDLCRLASLSLHPFLGTDHLMLAAMVKILLHEELIDPKWANDHRQDLAELSSSLESLDLAYVEEVTRVPAERLAQAVRLLSANRPGVILFGSGITHYATATESLRAIYDLALLLGGNEREAVRIVPVVGQGNIVGAYDMGACPDHLPGYQPLSNGEALARYERAWGHPLNNGSGLKYGEIVQHITEQKVKAVYLVGELPPTAALKELEFLVIQEIFPTPNVEYADVVLPATSFAETEGTFTNLEGRVQWLSKANEPPGDARADWWICCQIARKMEGKGFDYEHPSQIMDEIARLVPAYEGVSYTTVRSEGVYRRLPEVAGGGYDRLLPLGAGGGLLSITDEEYPFALILERNLFHYRGGSLTRRVKGMELIKDEKTVGLNPQDAAKLGIGEGDHVVVVSKHGEVRTTARLMAEGLPAGLAFMSVNIPQGCALFPGMVPDAKACAVRIEKG
jgi:formate dehydrogenase alpha subunit